MEVQEEKWQRDSQVQINTSETKEHLAGQETWTTGRETVEGYGKDSERTQTLPQKLGSIKGSQWELPGRVEKHVKVRDSLISESAAKKSGYQQEKREGEKSKSFKIGSKELSMLLGSM